MVVWAGMLHLTHQWFISLKNWCLGTDCVDMKVDVNTEALHSLPSYNKIWTGGLVVPTCRRMSPVGSVPGFADNYFRNTLWRNFLMVINLKCTQGLRCWPVAHGMLFIPRTSSHFLQMLQDKWAKPGFGWLKWNPANFTVRLTFLGRRNTYITLKISLSILILYYCFLATLNLDLRPGIPFISPILICFWQTILPFTLTCKTGLSLTWELSLQWEARVVRQVHAPTDS